MLSNIQTIKLDQKIPISVLDTGIYHWLQKDTVDKEELKKHLSEFIEGKNRLKKAVSHAYKILTFPISILTEIKKQFSADSYIQLPEKERYVLILSILSYSYPVFYQTLNMLGKLYKIQEVANSGWIKEKLSSIYGSNRSLELGIYSVIPMLLELKQLKRTKRSIYKAEPNYKILHPVIQEIYLYTDIYLSGSKSILKNDTLHRPWYVFNNLRAEFNYRTSLLKSDNDYIFLSC